MSSTLRPKVSSSTTTRGPKVLAPRGIRRPPPPSSSHRAQEATCSCKARGWSAGDPDPASTAAGGGREKSIWETLASSRGVSAALAAFLAVNVSGADPWLGSALAGPERQDLGVVESATIKVSDAIKSPASIVKDCRTDSPGSQDVYWISSQSVGQKPVLYPVDKDGNLIGSEYEVQTGQLVGGNVGQEEIVFVHRTRKSKKEDFIVLADTSNKFKNRDQLKFYEVAPGIPNPASHTDQVVQVERDIAFAFPSSPSAADQPEQTSSSYKIPIGPAPKVEISYVQEDYDTAAIIVVDDALWAFSKRSLGSSTALYRLPVETISPNVRDGGGRETYTLDFVQEFSSGSPACGADVSSDGTRLALMTRSTVFIFDLTDKSNPIANLSGRIPLPKLDGAPVGVTWDDPKTLVVLTDSNELTRMKLSA